MKRRDFLWKSGIGLAGLATAGCAESKLNIFIPKQSLDDYLQRYTPIVEDLASNNQTPSQFLYSSMLSDGQGVSMDYSRNEGEKLNYSGPRLASETEKGDIDGKNGVNIFDLLELLKMLGNKIPATPAADIDGNGKVNIFDLLDLLKILAGTYNTYLVKGQHFDNDTEQGKKAVITINGQQYFTEANGLFNIRRPKESNYVITARQTDDNNLTGFRTTENILGADYTALNLFSVSYPTQEGVTPELFREFCNKASFGHGGNGFGYFGLKTGIKNTKNRFWISSHGDSATFSEGGRATSEEQAYVKSIIENEIYSHLRQEYHFPIYLEDPNNPEIIPALQEGVIAVIPRNESGFGHLPFEDENVKDGIKNSSVIYLPNGEWNEAGKSGILQEAFSSLVSVNEVAPGYGFDYGKWEGSKWRAYSALASIGGGVTEGPKLMQSDDKLINIEHRYPPLEDIENILGM